MIIPVWAVPAILLRSARLVARSTLKISSRWKNMKKKPRHVYTTAILMTMPNAPAESPDWKFFNRLLNVPPFSIASATVIPVIPPISQSRIFPKVPCSSPKLVKRNPAAEPTPKDARLKAMSNTVLCQSDSPANHHQRPEQNRTNIQVYEIDQRDFAFVITVSPSRPLRALRILSETRTIRNFL